MYINCKLHGHKSWASDIRKLKKNRFNEVCYKQHINLLILKVINQRIADLDKHDVFGKVGNSKKCTVYI